MLSLVCTAAQAVVGKWADALTVTVKGRSRFEAISELQLFAALIERPHPHVFARSMITSNAYAEVFRL
jgi:hypothetical protein